MRGCPQFLSPQSVFKGELGNWLISSKGYGLINYLELLLSSVIISAISKKIIYFCPRKHQYAASYAVTNNTINNNLKKPKIYENQTIYRFLNRDDIVHNHYGSSTWSKQ